MVETGDVVISGAYVDLTSVAKAGASEAPAAQVRVYGNRQHVCQTSL